MHTVGGVRRGSTRRRLWLGRRSITGALFLDAPLAVLPSSAVVLPIVIIFRVHVAKRVPNHVVNCVVPHTIVVLRSCRRRRIQATI